MFCMYCGSRIPDGAAFCPACGKPTGAVPASPPEQSPVPIDAPASVETPAPIDTAAPVEAHVPEETPAPVETPAPMEAAAPVEAPVPEETPAPVAASAAEETPAPEQTPVPEEAPAPDPNRAAFTISAETPAQGTAEASVPMQIPVEAPAPEQGPAGRKKSRLPLIIGLAAAGLVLLVGAVLLIRGLLNRSAADSPAAEAAVSAVESGSPEETADTPADSAPEAAGARLYTGTTGNENVDSITVSFVLGEDRSEIHDFMVEVRDFHGKTADGSISVDLNGSSTQTVSGSYPVDYEGDNRDISIGKHVIEELRFREDGSAFLRFTYTFFQIGLGGPAFEIPVPGLEFEMTSSVTEDENAGAPSAAVPEEADEPEEDSDPSAAVPVYDEPFDPERLRNWDEAALLETCGVSSLSDFVPANPQPLYYIVSAEEVIDPVTGEISAGGYDKDYHRELPIDTERLMLVSGRIRDSALILTDDPDLATYALILHFSYTAYETRSFHFADGTTAPEYDPGTSVTLLNLTTGRSVSSEMKKTYGTQVGEQVYSAMLDNARGKQFYGDAAKFYMEDIPGLAAFLEMDAGEAGTSAAAAAEETTGASITFLIPAYMLEDSSPQEIAETLYSSSGYEDAWLGDDGSGYITMTPDQHQSALKEMALALDSMTLMLGDFLGGEVSDYSHNEDMTEFRIVTETTDDTEGLDLVAGMLGAMGLTYCITDCRPYAVVHVEFADSVSGAVFFEKTVTDLRDF